MLDRLVREGKIGADKAENYLLLAAEGPSQSLRPMAGLLARAMEARKSGKKGVLVYEEQKEEGGIVSGLDVIPVRNLEDVIHFLNGEKEIKPLFRDTREIFAMAQKDLPNDMADIIEDENAKHALEIAAIGRHHSILYGDVRAGKKRLVEHLPAIMPRMSLSEALETTLRFSNLGQLALGSGLMAHRPLLTISPIISLEEARERLYLSHLGVLHLQDLSEINKEVLNLVSGCLRDGTLTWKGKRMPCRPWVIGTLEEVDVPETLSNVFDLYVEVPIIAAEDHLRFGELEASLEIRDRVEEGARRQEARYEDEADIGSNADIPMERVSEWVHLDKQTEMLLSISLKKHGIYLNHRPQILRVSRSIADRVGEEEPLLYHVAEAIQYMNYGGAPFG